MKNFCITARFKPEHLRDRLTKPLNQSHLVYLVSMGKRKSNVHENHHLEAAIDLLNKYQPKKVTIVMAGKLQRHSFWNSNFYSKWSKLSEIELKDTLENFTLTLTEEAIKRGEEWKNNNESIVNKLTSCDPVFMMWDDILNSKNYQEYYQLIQKWYKEDPIYQKVIEESALAYVTFHNKDIKNDNHRNLAKEQCVKYLLEECPLIMPPLFSSDYVLYHAEPNTAMIETYNRLYPSQALPWFPVHYQFEEHRIFNPIIENQLIGISSKFYSKRQEKKTKTLAT